MSEAESKAEANGEEQPLGARLIATLLAAWLVPGAGHLMLGKRRRAIVFFLIVAVALTVGCSLDGNLHRVVPNQPLTLLATLGTMGVGAPYFALRYLFGYQGSVVAPGYEYGSAFILTAGLMNLLLILDVWDIIRGRKA